MQGVQKWFFLPDGVQASKGIENRWLRGFEQLFSSIGWRVMALAKMAKVTFCGTWIFTQFLVSEP